MSPPGRPLPGMHPTGFRPGQALDLQGEIRLVHRKGRSLLLLLSFYIEYKEEVRNLFWGASHVWVGPAAGIDRRQAGSRSGLLKLGNLAPANAPGRRPQDETGSPGLCHPPAGVVAVGSARARCSDLMLRAAAAPWMAVPLSSGPQRGSVSPPHAGRRGADASPGLAARTPMSSTAGGSLRCAQPGLSDGWPKLFHPCHKAWRGPAPG